MIYFRLPFRCFSTFLKRLGSLALLSVAATGLLAENFSVVAYNVENLFDADGVALYKDHQPPFYTREHFLTKITNITAVLSRYNSGLGPDVILLQEIEADQTPEAWDGDLDGFLQQHADSTVKELIREKWTRQLAGIPAQVWLYKSLIDAGSHPYFMAVGDDTTAPAETRSSVVNVTLSRFPIVETRLHPLIRARPVLETVLDIDGHFFHVFNNHWKAGASNPTLETVRVGNARVLRKRIDQIFAEDPQTDILIGGDLNSHYNQSLRFPEIPATGINTLLGSQGDEIAIRDPKSSGLYNLWFELPEEQRGADVYRGEWGTLMHLIISRGLYDHQGIQYVDGSFEVSIFPELNADPVTHQPLRWNPVGKSGGGYSDHFPLVAQFKTVDSEPKSRWLNLTNPSRDPNGPPDPRIIEYRNADFSDALDAVDISREWGLQKTPKLIGRTFKVRGKVTGEFPFLITVEDEVFSMWNEDVELRKRIYQAYPVGSSIEFYGQLNLYYGKWQFLIPHETWIDLPPISISRPRRPAGTRGF